MNGEAVMSIAFAELVTSLIIFSITSLRNTWTVAKIVFTLKVKPSVSKR